MSANAAPATGATDTTTANAGQAGDKAGDTSTTGANGAGDKSGDTGGDKKSFLGDAASGDDTKGATDAKADGSKDGKSDAGDLKIELPEGTEADPKDLEVYKSMAKDTGLNSEQASKLAGWWIKRQTEAVQARAKEWDTQQQAWAKELQDDPDYGGKNLEQTKTLVRKALKQFGGVEVSKIIDAADLGNHPALVRFVARIGKAMAEDDSAAEGGSSAGKPDPKQQLREMYPSMYDAAGNPTA